MQSRWESGIINLCLYITLKHVRIVLQIVSEVQTFSKNYQAEGKNYTHSRAQRKIA